MYTHVYKKFITHSCL